MEEETGLNALYHYPRLAFYLTRLNLLAISQEAYLVSVSIAMHRTILLSCCSWRHHTLNVYLQLQRQQASPSSCQNAGKIYQRDI